MIVTLLITILVEGTVVIAYALWRKKPLYAILLTSICGNLITQSLLWIGLQLFFQNYVMTLIIAESGIWLIEGFLFCSISANRLRFANALLLSLIMNLTSFTFGLFLPV